MIVEKELQIAVAEDIPAYARAHALRRTVKKLAAGAVDLVEAAETVPVLVVEALLSDRAVRELRRLRQAELVLDLVRLDAWSLYRVGALPASSFDAIVLEAARCRRDVGALLVHARRRAWARLHGAACANASSRRATSEKNSSSSNRR